MRITHDAEADATYVYLVEAIRPGDVAVTRTTDIPGHEAALNIDLDSDGRLLGIEILGASRLLRGDSIQQAEDITRHH